MMVALPEPERPEPERPEPPKLPRKMARPRSTSLFSMLTQSPQSSA